MPPRDNQFTPAEKLIESQSCSGRGACGFVLTRNPDITRNLGFCTDRSPHNQNRDAQRSHARPGSNQDAALFAILWNDRWCFSRSIFALICRSSFCRARLRMPGSFSPSKILGGSGLVDAATASSNWVQILHGICLYPWLKRIPFAISTGMQANGSSVLGRLRCRTGPLNGPNML